MHNVTGIVVTGATMALHVATKEGASSTASQIFSEAINHASGQTSTGTIAKASLLVVGTVAIAAKVKWNGLWKLLSPSQNQTYQKDYDRVQKKPTPVHRKQLAKLNADIGMPSITEQAEQLKAKEKQLQAKEEVIKNKERIIQTRDEQIDKLNQQLVSGTRDENEHLATLQENQRLNEQIAKKDRKLAKKDASIQKLTEENVALNAKVDRLEKQIQNLTNKYDELHDMFKKLTVNRALANQNP